MSRNRQGRLLLIVEGDLSFADQVANLSIEDRVVVARSIDEAVDIAEGGRVDAAILGPSLGNEAGAVGAAALSKADPGLPLVMVANVLSNRVLRAALRSGMLDVLETPLTPRAVAEVLARVDRQAARRPMVDIVVEKSDRVEPPTAGETQMPSAEPPTTATASLASAAGMATGGRFGLQESFDDFTPERPLPAPGYPSEGSADPDGGHPRESVRPSAAPRPADREAMPATEPVSASGRMAPEPGLSIEPQSAQVSGADPLPAPVIPPQVPATDRAPQPPAQTLEPEPAGESWAAPTGQSMPAAGPEGDFVVPPVPTEAPVADESAVAPWSPEEAPAVPDWVPEPPMPEVEPVSASPGKAAVAAGPTDVLEVPSMPSSPPPAPDAGDAVPPPFEPDEISSVQGSSPEAVARRPMDLAEMGLADPDPGSQVQVHRGSGSGRVVTVMSGKGGSGKTIAATNLAMALNETVGEDRVVIVDADLQFGDVALLLQIDPVRTIVDAARMIDGLTEPRLDALLIRHDSGLRVMPAPLVPVAADQVNPKLVVRVVEMLRNMYDYVIVDTPPVFDDGLVTIMEHSDDVLLVVDMDLPSVKNAKLALDTLRSSGFDLDTIHLVVNRVNSKARLDLVELERSLGKEVAASIPSDRLIPQSVNEGVPAVAFSPRSRVAKSFQAIARMFLPD